MLDNFKGISLDQAEAMNAIVWILNNRMVNENGSLVEFRDHRFLIDPYMDDSERQVIIKCAQIGWSTLAIFRSFHLARFAGANIIHTFPSRNMSKDFVIPKVNPLILKNKALSEIVFEDSLGLKKIGDRFIYYRGSYEQTEAISISAHIVINDEYDRSNQKVLRTYRTRLDDARRDARTMQLVVEHRDKTIRRRDATIDRLKATVARLAMRHAVVCN